MKEDNKVSQEQKEKLEEGKVDQAENTLSTNEEMEAKASDTSKINEPTPSMKEEKPEQKEAKEESPVEEEVQPQATVHQEKEEGADIEQVEEKPVESIKDEKVVKSQPEAQADESLKEDTSEEPIKNEARAEEGPEKPSAVLEDTEAEKSPGKPAAISEDSENEDDEDKEEEDSENEDEEEEVDYGSMSKEELVKTIESLTELNNFKKIDGILKEIKPLFDAIKNKERTAALEKYIADGGEEDSFEFKYDGLSERFDASYKLLRDKKSQYFKEQERLKEENLQKKNEILERLRNLVDGEETTTSITVLKEIQSEWKKIGPVATQHVKSLWANYNALLDRFYDNRSIYFELKELDRKKNLEAKLELCTKAEKLIDYENIKQATRELNELHEEFKHIGPVPKEEQEALWERFKSASDSVYAKKREFVDELKKELKKNLEKKMELVDEVLPFIDFDSDRINEWNKKTKEILALQKKWEASGGLPRDKAKDVNKAFWGSFKRFFSNKSQFFKKLEGQRYDNLKSKEELVQQAEALKESVEWEKTAEELKKLQRQWKDIGPVPEKHRNEIYKRFKEACDFFFESKRAKSKDFEKEYYDNLDKKESICSEIESMVKAGNFDLDRMADLQDEWTEIGFVPKDSIKKINERFLNAVNSFADKAEDLDDGVKAKVRLGAQISKMKGGPNASRKIHQKENTIRNKIKNLENDIATWKNNLEFFADSKKANKLKDEFEEKIESASEELANLKSQLRLLRNA